MSETYKDLPHTGLPEKKTNLIKFRDPYASEINLANQYDSYIASGKVDLAQTLLNDNPSLKECILNADIILTLLHDDIALQRIFFDDIETYIMSVIQYDKEYTEGKACARYAVVPYNNQVYFCYEACPEGTLPTDTNYFYPITLKGDKGNPGVNFVPMGKWESGTAYSINQAVSWDSKLWYSLVDNNTEEPSNTSTKWDSFFILSQTAADMTMADGSTVENKVSTMETILTEHVNDKNNPHNITAATLGLDKVTNQSKQEILANAELTGVPVAPTANVGTNNLQIANTAFVMTAISNAKSSPFYVGSSAPSDTSILWIDTNTTTGGLKYYNESSWVHVPVAYTN